MIGVMSKRSVMDGNSSLTIRDDCIAPGFRRGTKTMFWVRPPKRAYRRPGWMTKTN